MSRSNTEEIIAGVHWIAAMALFYAGWSILGWFFVGRALLDEVASLVFAYKEAYKERRGGSND